MNPHLGDPCELKRQTDRQDAKHRDSVISVLYPDSMWNWHPEPKGCSSTGMTVSRLLDRPHGPKGVPC
ncbi:hypothetical protein LIA77_04614 [Sarocladium implicatum]|nr:hypothetical protein LIA77_04614 [Sarocladium implicatum]